MSKLGFFSVLIAVAVLLVGCPSDAKTDDPKPGAFSVALASRAAGVTESSSIVGTAAGVADAAMALGTGVKVNSVSAAADVSYTVYLLANDYVNADGTLKDTTKYQINWDAYAPASPTTTLKAALTLAQVAGKEAWYTLTVPASKITAGVVVVAQIYNKPATGTATMGLGKTEGRVAEYQLTITKQATISLTGRKVTANGLAKATTAPAVTDLTAAAGGTVTVGTPNKATVALTAAATATHKVVFNAFALDSPADDGVNLTKILGNDGTGTGLVTTKVSNSDTAGTGDTVQTVTGKSRADFDSTANKNGQVTLTFENKYGQTVEVLVTLDDLLA